MSFPQFLEKLAGEWTGTNRLWLMPGDPGRECSTTASIDTVVNGQFLSIRYTWDFEGAPQEGWILLGSRSGSEEISPEAMQAVWFD